MSSWVASPATFGILIPSERVFRDSSTTFLTAYRFCSWERLENCQGQVRSWPMLGPHQRRIHPVEGLIVFGCFPRWFLGLWDNQILHCRNRQGLWATQNTALSITEYQLWSRMNWNYECLTSLELPYLLRTVHWKCSQSLHNGISFY